MKVLENLFILIFLLKYGCPTSITFLGFTKVMSSFKEANTHRTTTAAELIKRLSTIPASTKTTQGYITESSQISTTMSASIKKTYGKITEIIEGATTNSSTTVSTNQGSATTNDFTKTTYGNITESTRGTPSISGTTVATYQGLTTASEPTKGFTPDSGTMKTTKQEPILTSDSTETIAENGRSLDEISPSDCSQSIQKMRTAFICLSVGVVVIITAVIIMTILCQRRGSYTFKWNI